jgi:hypothetical protein
MQPKVYDTWLLSFSPLECCFKISRACCQAEASVLPGTGEVGGVEKGLKWLSQMFPSQDSSTVLVMPRGALLKLFLDSNVSHVYVLQIQRRLKYSFQ